ncbi:hypothetical protein [Actinomadura roseirufa]|uniref:hypothetical protein n=1 Tax=Actinomadura roseirufa TaxID=2094049 RepID=UPI00104182CD|nr:hypothetical protein [Actinomadura roseirufa]
MGHRDRGATSLEYGALILVVAALCGGLASTVSDRPVRACRNAVCQIFGGDCGKQGIRSAAKDGASPAGEDGRQVQPLVATRPADAAPVQDKPPIPKQVCSPDPDAKWVEKLNAHNDYENKAPLKGALSNGVTSVEVDLAFDPYNRLVVTHSPVGDPEGKEFRKTYIEPLIKRAERNNGQIYPGRTEKFQVFVEVKFDRGDAKRRKEAYDKIMAATRGLPENVEVVLPVSLSLGQKDAHPVEHPPPGVTYSQQFDRCDSRSKPGCENGELCRIPDALNPAVPKSGPAADYQRNVTVLNDGFKECVSRDGGSLSEEEKRQYQILVDRAHNAGLKVRIWGAPDGSVRAPMSPGQFVPCRFKSCRNDQRHDWWNLAIGTGTDYLVSNHLGTGADWLRHCGSPKKR